MILRRGALALISVVLLFAASCHGGGGGTSQVQIVKINLNPASATAGSIIELSASISAPGQSVSSLVKDWEVSAGSLSLVPPDFSMLIRGTSKAASDDSTTSSTTNSVVYWMVPTTPGPATITLTVGTATKDNIVQVVNSPIVLSVTDGTGGKKVCTVSASNVSDLYQAAFRVNFTSAWKVNSVNPGDFLGSANDTLFIGLSNQSGFVPVAITKKGDVAGENGSGVLATITFDPVDTSSGVSSVADVPFTLDAAILRTSGNQPVPGAD